MGFSFLARYSFGSAVSRIPTLVPPLQDRNPADGVLFRTSDPKVETWTGGVALQSVSPAHSMHLSVPCPHAVSDIESFCSEDQRVTMPRGFRALFPARIRSLRPTGVGRGSMLSWAFSSRRNPDSALAADPVARFGHGVPNNHPPPKVRTITAPRAPHGGSDSPLRVRRWILRDFLQDRTLSLSRGLWVSCRLPDRK
jgi:hypothetical protein